MGGQLFAFLALLLAYLSALPEVSAIPAFPQCSCDLLVGREKQLIRGPDELSLCDSGYYCSCSDSVKERCLTWWVFGPTGKFDEDSQDCVKRFDCAAFFAKATTSISEKTTPPTAATPAADPATQPTTSAPAAGGNTVHWTDPTILTWVLVANALLKTCVN